MAYSLSTKFIAELLSMTVYIAIGNGCTANEVLPRTKGNSMGMGFVAIAYGLAFFIATAMFGHISTVPNPAFVFAQALTGVRSWREALALMAADFVGALLGAVVVYLAYLPHFSLAPPPPPEPPRWIDAYVRPEAARDSAFVSYDGGGGGGAGGERQRAGLRRRRSHAGSTGELGSWRGASIQSVATPADGGPMGSGGGGGPMGSGGGGPIGRGDGGGPLGSGGGGDVSVINGNGASHDAERGRELSAITAGSGLRDSVGDGATWLERARRNASSVLRSSIQLELQPGALAAQADQRQQLQQLQQQQQVAAAGAEQADRAAAVAAAQEAEEAYRGALQLDQNAKLSAFCMRPAVYHRPLNLISETACTFVLVWAILLFNDRRELFNEDPPPGGWTAVYANYLGFAFMALMMALSGPTGFCANPARDLGPRIAHALLPLPNKGSSEWGWAPVPFFGGYLGGFIAACFYQITRNLQDHPPWHTSATATFGGYWS